MKSQCRRRSRELAAVAAVAHRPPEPPPSILTITITNNDIHQLDHVSRHYSRLSWKPSYFPLIHPTPSRKQSLPKGGGEDVSNFFFSLITYYVPGTWLRKAFLSLCEVGTRTWGPRRMHQSKVTQSCHKNCHSRKPVPVHNGDTIHNTINTSREMKKLKAGTV